MCWTSESLLGLPNDPSGWSSVWEWELEGTARAQERGHHRHGRTADQGWHPGKLRETLFRGTATPTGKQSPALRCFSVAPAANALSYGPTFFSLTPEIWPGCHSLLGEGECAQGWAAFPARNACLRCPISFPVLLPHLPHCPWSHCICLSGSTFFRLRNWRAYSRKISKVSPHWPDWVIHILIFWVIYKPLSLPFFPRGL